ncbi:MAG: aromatic ring-hydroxylating dioxygenase subunit alpha [Acidimicrobiia bacterium]|nr:aromatic ring-hydroxylating dioxygenase subunit alpha [Acidimicrobiia bacterium]MDH4306405.1 aromatic ring-hydroxylating dioxygenase subunit alpha [Acidimicrobiia bacterium]MDH5293597.1 aromatic ring-hydroxylating dioxygenase subunit alpha [Acidimicrobiia bacterium]
MTTLSRHWHPIATASEVTAEPRRFTLLGTDLVAFRGDHGLSLFTDLCIHRGVALSLGFIENGILHCGYHGWAYDGTGACVKIPSLPPGSPIPPKARAITHRVEERYGLVWACLDEPEQDIPPFPDDEWNRSDYRTFVSHHYTWETSAGRAVENFMDISHFPFVHEGTLGSRDATEVAEHTVEERNTGLYYYLEAPEPASLHSGADDVIRWEYFLTGPFTIHLRKTIPSGDQTLISLVAAPTSEKTTDMFLWIGRNYQLDPSEDGEFIDFTHEIMEQDRLIVESQRPEQIPTNLRDELHLRIPDASGIAYRRLLGAISGAGPFLP